MREVAAGRGIAGPVIFSLLLHGGVLALFARGAFAPQAEARNTEPPPNIRVSLAMRPAPRQPAPPIQQSPEPAPAAEEPLVVTEAPAAVLEPDTDELALEAEPVPAVTTRAVRAAVGTYLSNRQDTQTATWVADCIIEQKARGTRDCEQLQEAPNYLSGSARAGRDVIATAYADVTQRERYARLTAELEQEKVVMEDLMEDGGLLGQMATDRYYLDLQYVLYLNGNPSPYGPGNQFNCKGTGACNYVYTGFVVKRPEAVVDEDAFRVVPTLFGSRQ